MKLALQRLQEPFEPVSEELVSLVRSQVHHTTVTYDATEDGVRFPRWIQEHNQGHRLHGYARSYYAPGVLQEQQFYVNGVEHGLSTQYTDDGKLLGAYLMDMGTGVDLWYSPDGTMSEEVHFVHGSYHGPKRHWADWERLRCEEFYKKGARHGIFRDWSYDEQGRLHLEPESPIFFIEDKLVTKEQYQSASMEDEDLIPYQEQDDSPARFIQFASPWPRTTTL